jgi:hypothetical protein
MAKRTITQLVSDLSGKEIRDGDGETIRFSIGSASYELDLTSSEAGKFYDDLQKYTDKATKISGRNPRTGGGGRGKSDREQLQAAREWLRAHGHDVSDRGRIKQDLMNLYISAH